MIRRRHFVIKVVIMFSLGIISDIHSNIIALEASIADMELNYPEIEDIYCIGDLVGYSPDPKKCIDFLFNNRRITKVVKGNHEHYVDQTVTPPQVTPLAKAAIDYQIDNIPLELRWELAQLPQFITTKHMNVEIALVHGSPQYPLTAYIYPETKEQEDLFQYMKNVEEPNLILLRNAEIINRIKNEGIQEIPEMVNDLDEFSDEIDVTTLFESETDTSERNEVKQKIFLLIEKSSAKGNGITFEKLKQDVKISDNELRTFLNDLILESRIYKSDNDNFEAF